MSIQLIFHPKAQQEYIEAYWRYENLEKRLGLRFELQIETCLTQISENPTHFH